MNMRMTRLVVGFCLITSFALMPVITGCSGSRAVVPPVTVENRQVYQVGKFVWFDLFTTDIELAASFYEGLFGWKFTQVSSQNHQLLTISSNGVPIGNIVQRKKTGVGSKWLSYLSVADYENALETITRAHGKVLHNIGDLPDRGKVAVVADDQEATFAVIKSSTGDPADETLVANQWADCELWTKNVNTAQLFYRQLVQYEPQTIQLTDNITYTRLIRDGFQRGGIVKIPWEEIKPEWIPYVAVKDVVAVTAMAKKLGGKIMLEPEIESIEGRVAIIADPSGAVLGLQQIAKGGE